jgi:hypothetical protein
MPDDGRKREAPPSALSGVGRHMGHGLTIAGAIGFFMAVGWWADGKLGVSPLLTVLGAFVGGAAGFYGMWRDLVVRPREGSGESASGPEP